MGILKRELSNETKKKKNNNHGKGKASI